MKYETFKKKIVPVINRKLAPGSHLDMEPVTKLNGSILDGIRLAPDVPGDVDEIIMPTLYLNDLYEMYQEGRSLNDIAELAVFGMQEYDYSMWEPTLMGLNDFDSVKDNICCRLVNIGLNKEMLNGMPYIQFLDLAVVYYVLVILGNECYRTNISYDLLESWGKTKADISELAAVNTRRLNEARVWNLGDMMDECSIDDEFAGEESHVMVITGRTNSNGAIHMLDKTLLGSIADDVEDDLVIIPSSIHEFMVAPQREVRREFVDEVIRCVNGQVVPSKDLLSDHSYLFLRNEKRVVM